ncbi:MAG: hypothetical protein ACD_20C00020G0005 [uncultured bacterium]|nr:MAG: hypothetical protein ACD_20C00020G0005 [uncultured bacterium]
MSSKGTIAVAMSGGVDSSTAAILLKKDGYEVIGVTGIMHEGAYTAAQNAAEVCNIFGIKHYSADLRDVFKDEIIKYFEESYKKGLTPNPCAVCNRTIKWGALKKYSHEVLKADLYATGHYARIIKENNNYKLVRANDDKKDQIYMLFSLNQDDLATTLFPLGDLTKPEVREIAKNHNLPCAQSKESQDVCFIQPPDSTQKYLVRTFGEQEGNIVDIKTGKILGKHTGAYKYTVGQRKGIGIAASEPLYVASVCPEKNDVYVGFLNDISRSELEVHNVNWQQEGFKNSEFSALVKIRYNSSAKKAMITSQDNGSVIIKFNEPEFAITPGQVAVFYDLNNEYLIGGGWIK